MLSTQGLISRTECLVCVLMVHQSTTTLPGAAEHCRGGIDTWNDYPAGFLSTSTSPR